jgi:hypothetical protein
MNLRKRFSLDETRSSRAPIVQIHDLNFEFL